MHLFKNGIPVRARRYRATLAATGGKTYTTLPKTQLEVTDAGIKGGQQVYHCYNLDGEYIGLYAERQLEISK